MKLIKCLLTENDCYKKRRIITPEGIMVHSTGANNPYIKRYVQPNVHGIGENTALTDWNRNTVRVCVHAFIGKLADGSIATCQTLPWDYRAWHCGSGKKGSANNTHVSFEICEDGLTDKNYFNAVYKEAVEFTAMLCKMYELDPLRDGVVITHSEGYKRGIASNHADVMHWFPKFGKTMDTFRSDVKKEMGEDEMTQNEFDKMLENWLERQGKKAVDAWAKGEFQEAVNAGITDGSRPKSHATRQEVAVMIKRALGKK